MENNDKSKVVISPKMSSYSFQGRSRVWVPRDEEENRAIFSTMRQETGIKMPEEFKPIYLENEEYEVEKWSPKQLIKLLRLYGSHRCLWHPDDPFHKNRKMRKAAMIDISAALGKDVTMEMVGQKINVLRSTYRYEKRRIKQRIKKGVGAKTKLKWFALADSFLRNVPRADKFKKPEGAAADSDSDLEDTIVFTIEPEILIPLEEDNSGNQNCITIGDDVPVDNPQTSEINEQTEEIHQMLENHNEDYKIKNPRWKWKPKKSINFLKIYRKHRCLWDTSDENFKNKERRVDALKAIVNELDSGITVGQVTRKIVALRAAYRLERRRLAEEAFKENNKPQSRLKWYPLADSFLRPFCTFRKVAGGPEMRDEPYEYKESDEETHNQSAGDSDMDDDFNNDSEDEPISHLKLELSIKSESESEEKTTHEKAKKLIPMVKIPRIRLEPEPEPVRSWTLADSRQFIELLSIHSCLWDRKHPNFKKLPERSVAYEDIAHKMDMPEKRIRKKTKILLRTYFAEREKIEKSDTYQTELAWYHLADEFFGQKDEEMPPPPSIPPMSFIDPDLMSPAPSLFKESNNDQEIKLEDPESPMGGHFDDAVSSPAAIEDPAPTETDDLKPEIKTETIPNEEDLPQPPPEQSDDKTLTKIIWNGLEDDLLEGKWSLKNSVKFLRLYGAHRCLWDLNHPDHRDKLLRDAALEDIAAAMGHGLTAEYVWKKIKIFRITYMQHRKRMVEAMKANKEPEIQLRWFPLADSFLRPHIGLRSIKSDEKELPQFDFQYVYANLNLIDPALLNDFEGKGTQNSIELGCGAGAQKNRKNLHEESNSEDESEGDDSDDEFFKGNDDEGDDEE